MDTIEVGTTLCSGGGVADRAFAMSSSVCVIRNKREIENPHE